MKYKGVFFVAVTSIVLLSSLTTAFAAGQACNCSQYQELCCAPDLNMGSEIPKICRQSQCATECAPYCVDIFKCLHDGDENCYQLLQELGYT